MSVSVPENKHVIVAETARLRLQQMRTEDAGFLLQLMNQPAYHAFIGDRGLRSVADAEGYLESGLMAMYREFGFGLYLVVSKHNDEPMGICGLVQRETLPGVDIGFAFLSEFWGQGYAGEAAQSVIDLARNRFGLKQLLAITAIDNAASVKLLQKLEFTLEQILTIEGEQLNLFVRSLMP